jgi:hypothetical protein
MLFVCLAHDLVGRSRVHLEGVHRLLDVSHANCRRAVCFLSQRCNLAKVEIPKFGVCGFL